MIENRPPSTTPLPTTGSQQTASRRPAADPGGDQSEALGFLNDPASYGAAVTEVQRIDTHGAMVFLAGDRAYKIKRAVHYPYMDFSTLEKRHRACARELALNVRTAPTLYRKVIAVTRNKDGILSFGGGGTPVEWVLVMKRFKQEQLLSNIAAAGGLTDEIARDLADTVAAFHHTAPPPSDDTLKGAESIEWVVVENNQELAEREDLFPPVQAARLAELSLDQLARRWALLDSRSESGLLRFCHGDLHLRNVVLLDGRPTLFDAIEFNDAIACIDVFYDLAYLLMDLEHRGLRPLANLVLNRYLQKHDDLEALSLLPLFLSARATVRAKVAASLEKIEDDGQAINERRDEALSYFNEALRFLSPPPPRLVAVGGLSGSGKTSLAQALAPALGAAPGAVHLRSDVLRKTLAGVDEAVRLPPSAYSREAGQAVYDSMLAKAGRVLAAGHSVVIDGVFARPEERAAAEALAHSSGAAFAGFWLQADPEILTSRVEQRRHDASDATAAVVRQQLIYDLGDVDWTPIDAGASIKAVADQARRLLNLPD
ncbi:AAA family ATPase [Pelagibius litoralis]|uniref:AAA family ATPase n=1 Tax=Pelagibius litoralis TaxID=374515 RepID=A0A967F0E5_9PROT|nr:bifunctional aminoglycoside phosphotransferase/ATP-binding protein [Pelagibius litoralis]NIA70848.1 AAA family ATPase [Pelagibius litoralis]